MTVPAHNRLETPCGAMEWTVKLLLPQTSSFYACSLRLSFTHAKKYGIKSNCQTSYTVFPRSCSIWLQERELCHPIELQKDFNSALRLDNTHCRNQNLQELGKTLSKQYLSTPQRASTRRPQFLNCQTQYHLKWLVVSPFWQKLNSSGNLVPAGLLAFYAVQTCSKHALQPLLVIKTAAQALHRKRLHRRVLSWQKNVVKRPQFTGWRYLHVPRAQPCSQPSMPPVFDRLQYAKTEGEGLGNFIM